MQLEVDRPVQRLGQFLARGLADGLDLGAALADDDRFLARAFDQDDLMDERAAILPLLPFLVLDGAGIGQFLAELEVELFARDLGREKPGRQVGELVLRIEPGAGGNAGGEDPAQIDQPRRRSWPRP